MENIFPQEILDSSYGFNHEFRQLILSYLILNKQMTYSELKNIINAKNGNLNHHLHLLQKGSLIGKYLQKDENDRINSYYKITDFGKLFIEGMMAPLRKMHTGKSSSRYFAESLTQKHLFPKTFRVSAYSPGSISRKIDEKGQGILTNG